jgi:UDP-glucose 4-epimerase
MGKYFVIGGTGFIGRHLVDALVRRRDHVFVYGQDLTNAPIFSNNEIEFVKGDIRNLKLLMDSLLQYRPDTVIHLAAITSIKTCLDKPQESFDANVYGTYNVAVASAKSKSKLIFASSREVYGETTKTETSEESILAPNNLYGVTKMLGENTILWAGRKNGIDYTILRLTNVYGPGGDKYGVQAIIQKVLRGDRIQVLGGDQVMNFVYIDDVVRALLLCIENEKSSKQIFNVGSYDNVAVKDLVHKIVKLAGRNLEIERAPYRETETMFFRPDLSKIAKILNWTPLIDLDTGLLRTIEWYKNSHKF